MGQYAYGSSTSGTSAAGILVADPVYTQGGGDVTVGAGSDVLGRRDAFEAGNIQTVASNVPSWIGGVDEPWRVGGVGTSATAMINPQLFTDGLGTLGGGSITVSAGRTISDLSMIATNSIVTSNLTGGGVTTKAVAALGGGNLAVFAAADILGGRADVASGSGEITAGRNIATAGTVAIAVVDATGSQPIDNLLRLRITDATVDINAGADLTLQGVASLGVLESQLSNAAVLNNLSALGLYSAHAATDLVANGSIAVANGNDNLLTGASLAATNQAQNAVYPGAFSAAAITGDLNVMTPGSSNVAAAVLLVPSPIGQLQLLAGGDVAPATIAMLDSDPGILRGCSPRLTMMVLGLYAANRGFFRWSHQIRRMPRGGSCTTKHRRMLTTLIRYASSPVTISATHRAA